MTRQTRQIYLVCFFVAAAIVLPLILLYSSGYRINISSLSLEQTGSLFISSRPKGAEAILQPIEHAELTPAVIPGLTPGEYTVTISKDLYTSWNSSLSIEAKRSIVYSDVMLFLLNPIKEPLSTYPNNDIVTSEYTAVNALPAQMQYALSELPLSDNYLIQSDGVPMVTVLDSDNGNLYLLNETNDSIHIQPLESEVLGYAWEPELDILMFYTPFTIQLFNPDDASTVSLIRQSNTINEVLWHPQSPYIIFSTDKQIIAMETRLTDEPNSAVLYSGETVTNLKINEDGETIYFTNSVGEIIGLQIQ